MSLEKTHQEYILERLHKEYLYDGVIPTADQLQADLDEYQKTHPDFREPTATYSDFSIELGGEASSSLMEEIRETVDNDATIASREIYKVAADSQRFFDRWSIELNRLEAKSRKLEQRIDSLLLLEEDTTGYFAYVGDTFSDLNSVDTENTTAEINIRENNVTLSTSLESANDSSGGALIDLNDLTENDVIFTPLSTGDGTRYFTVNEENSINKIFHTENSQWVGKVVTNKSKEMICEMKVSLSPSQNLEISRVVMNWKGSDTSNRANVTLQYSADGYTWYLVPTNQATKALTANITWNFPLVEARWIKFIFYKPTPDNSENEYIYSSNGIKIFGQTYDVSVTNYLVSNSLSALDKDDNLISFSKVALNTCEEKPDNTSLTYYVSASKDNINWTDWFVIAPSSYEGISYPKVVNIGGVNWKDNNTSATLLDTASGKTQKQITRLFDAEYNGYRFKNTSFGVVNTAISVSEDEDQNLISNSIVLWRNIRIRDEYPDLLTVRDTPRGWGSDGSKYYCYFEIINSDGLTVDFGETEAELDGQSISGIVNITSGIHKFATKSDYWFDISRDVAELTSPLISSETFESIDPLYPYNHKYLIEGYPYPEAFTGEKKYKGSDKSAEFYSKNVSLFELENNSSDYSTFAVRGVGDESNPTLAVVLKYDTDNSDFINENCLVEWRSGEEDATMYKYVKFKASLSSSDDGVTPILSSYRLKLGF